MHQKIALIHCIDALVPMLLTKYVPNKFLLFNPNRAGILSHLIHALFPLISGHSENHMKRPDF